MVPIIYCVNLTEKSQNFFPLVLLVLQCPVLNKFKLLLAVLVILVDGFSLLYMLIVGLCMGNNNC